MRFNKIARKLLRHKRIKKIGRKLERHKRLSEESSCVIKDLHDEESDVKSCAGSLPANQLRDPSLKFRLKL
jgi:hypothetical protein